MRRSSLILLLYIVILQVLDATTTYIAVRSGAVELNPLVKLFANDLVKLLLFKTIVGLIIYMLTLDENVEKYQKIILLALYTIIMLHAIIINIVNSFI